MLDTSKSWFQTLFTVLIGSAVVSTVIGVVFTRYVTSTQEEIRSQRVWKERSVAELLGPMAIQFERSKRAFDRWNQKNEYVEAKVIKVANESVRDLLLTKSHLVPPDLFQDAGRLLEHYDVWLEEFDKLRGGKEPASNIAFVFAGTRQFPFPADSEQRFRERYLNLWSELYGPAAPTVSPAGKP